MAVEYKFKPYKPKNLKMATIASTKEEAQRKALESQRNNLDLRLRAEGIDPDTLGGEFDNRNLIEKTLNLRPDQGVLMDFFEIINRPVEAVKAGILAGAKGEDVISGAWEGLSGNAGGDDGYIQGSEFLQELGVETRQLTGAAKFLVDVGVDIALDPLTYLPAGFLIKGFKKLTTKTARRMIDVTGEAQEAMMRRLAMEFPDASADEILEAIVKTDSDDVFMIGQKSDFNKSNYLDADPKLRKQGQNYKKSIEGLEERANTLREILKMAPENRPYKVFDYVDTEMKVYDDIKEAIEKIDPENIKVVVTSSQNRLSDVLILKRYGDTDYFTKVGNLEVKKMVGAMGPTATVEVVQEGSKRVVKFASKSFGYSDEVVRRFDSFLDTQVNGKSLREMVLEVYDAKTVKGAARSVNIADLIKNDAQAVETFNSIVFDMMQEKGIKNLVFAQDGVPLYISLENARKYLKVGNGVSFFNPGGKNLTVTQAQEFLQRTKKARPNSADEFIRNAVSNDGMTIEDAVALWNDKRRQFRFRPTLNMSDETARQIIEAGDNLEFDDVVSQFTQREVTYEMGIIDRLAEKGGTIGEVGRALKRFTTNFKNLFSLTGDLPPEFRDMMKGIEGKTMIEMERRSARLASIKKALIASDPKAGRYLSELMEAGAYIDDAGNIKRLNRDYGLSDFFDYVYKRNIDGSPIILPEFADAAAKNNFIRQVNDLYYDYTSMINFKAQRIDDLRKSKNLFFDVAESNGGTVLKIENLGNQEMKEFLTWLANSPRANNFDNFVHFGQKRLSSGAMKLIKNNTAQYNEAASLMDDLMKTLVREGGFVNIPAELSGRIGYMRHIMTKEAYESLRLTMPGVANRFTKLGKDTLSKRIFIGSIDEVNSALREFSKLPVDLFDPNAFNAMEDLIKVTQRKVEQRQMLSLVLDSRGKTGEKLFKVVDNTVAVRKSLEPYETMIKSFDDEFPTLVKNLSDGSQRELKNILAAAGYTQNSAVVMHKNAVEILKRVEKAYVDLPDFVKTYDKFLNTWKGLTLITPGFHMRNLFGNSFNSYAAGMDLAAQSRYSTKAMIELDQFQKIGKKLASGAELTAKEQKLYKLVSGFYESGVAQTHRGIRDLEQIKEAVEAATKGGKLKTGYNNLIRLNFNFAEKMDDFQRYMLYRWALDKTGDSIKASRTVAESLFDYHHLTNFEKDFMKRLFPFYTFMKNNFVFQAKNIFNNPKAYARIGRAYKYGLESLAGYGPDDLPDYANENMWIPIPMNINKNDKEAIAFLKANLPLSDFTELVENPFKKGVISLTAPVKLLIEFGVGRDLFTGAPLSQFPGQTNAMEEGSGVLSGLRDSRGNLTITQSPIAQKIMNDIGLRTPVNIASTGLDIIDTLAGYQGNSEGLGDFMTRAGILGVQEVEKLEITKLYQDLERLRELKKYYEQETGNQLPVLPR
jgi:2-hydroxy-3-keto-5-methylthiopentenyl-1-phosphate phosphatase